MNVIPFLTRAEKALLATQRHNWEHGTAMQAFLEAGRMDVVIPMAREAVYRQLPDGRPAGMEPLDGGGPLCLWGGNPAGLAGDRGQNVRKRLAGIKTMGVGKSAP